MIVKKGPFQTYCSSERPTWKVRWPPDIVGWAKLVDNPPASMRKSCLHRNLRAWRSGKGTCPPGLRSRLARKRKPVRRSTLPYRVEGNKNESFPSHLPGVTWPPGRPPAPPHLPRPRSPAPSPAKVSRAVPAQTAGSARWLRHVHSPIDDHHAQNASETSSEAVAFLRW